MPRPLRRLAFGSIAPTALAVLIGLALSCTNHFADLSAEADQTVPKDDAGPDAEPDAPAVCSERAGILALLPPSLGAQHHVDPSGDDGAPGTAGVSILSR